MLMFWDFLIASLLFAYTDVLNASSHCDTQWTESEVLGEHTHLWSPGSSYDPS